MRKRFRIAFMLAIFAVMSGNTVVFDTHTVQAADAARFVLPGNTVFPEGIGYQASTGYFFTGSSTDGTIFRGDPRSGEVRVFLPPGSDGRTDARGMKADDANRLFICGGTTGLLFVYDTTSGALLGKFSAGGGAPNYFINDVAVTPSGDAYFTDSFSPFIYRVYRDGQGQYQFERWQNLVNSGIVYGSGFNLNGIVATPDGKYLIVVQTNTGKLFRVDLSSRAVTEIALGEATLANGDGLLLIGETLYVVRNRDALIVTVQLANQFSTGAVVTTFTDPSLQFPTTIAAAAGRILVVNSQMDKRMPTPNPVLPFTIGSVVVPPPSVSAVPPLPRATDPFIPRRLGSG